ncbi:MAG: GntR family transcriptional regulator [Rhodobacteraceae bacterium]|nr:GntR family transcriptional regulator [Paracoccaceae bacterium]
MEDATRSGDGRRPARALPKGKGSQRVHALLKERILSLDLPPGMPVEEGRLAAELGVSRTPIREALIRLGAERLVTLLPNRGAVVADLSLADVRDYFEALEFVQSTTTGLAAGRCDDRGLAAIERHLQEFEDCAARRDSNRMIETNRDFHVAIAAAAGNRCLYAISVSLYNEGLRVSRMAVTYDFDREHSLADHLRTIVVQHRDLVALIRARDADGAARLAGAHNDLARRRVAEVMGEALAGRR